jgi:hypothetical protein
MTSVDPDMLAGQTKRMGMVCTVRRLPESDLERLHAEPGLLGELADQPVRRQKPTKPRRWSCRSAGSIKLMVTSRPGHRSENDAMFLRRNPRLLAVTSAPAAGRAKRASSSVAALATSRLPVAWAAV